MIRKILSLILAAVLFTGCAAPQDTISKKRYQASFLTLFDTVTSIVGYAESEEEFEKITDDDCFIPVLPVELLRKLVLHK